MILSKKCFYVIVVNISQIKSKNKMKSMLFGFSGGMYSKINNISYSIFQGFFYVIIFEE